MSELKPCPFCGGEPRKLHPFQESNGLISIRCDCGANVAGGKLQDFRIAIRQWNTRAPDPRDELIMKLVGNIREVATIMGKCPRYETGAGGQTVEDCLARTVISRVPHLCLERLDEALAEAKQLGY